MFKIGFLEFSWIDIIDVGLVVLLFYQLYRLLKGSLAFNILIGLLFIYLMWLVVKALNMRLLTDILGQFIGVGFLAILIVFQPEIRRFLLHIGRNRLLVEGRVWKNIFSGQWRLSSERTRSAIQIAEACKYFAETKTGALIVFPRTSKLQFFANTGVLMDAQVSAELLKSIFQKSSPLHDGAVIIADNKVLAARCILPVSDNPDLPTWAGTRHRAAVGITERSDAIAIVVSEEIGHIAQAANGKLSIIQDAETLNTVLWKALEEE